jgi:uncharacterized membrane protein
MGSIAQAKTLGEIGSILVLLAIIPAFGSAVAVIGFILILIAVKYISDALHDSSIFSNILVAIVLAIVGVITGGLVVLGSVFRFIGFRNIMLGNTTTTVPTNFGPMIGGIIVGLVIVWIMFIVAAYFQRKSYEVVATRLNVGMFRTAAFVYLLGAALVIILVGFLLLFIAQILFVVAFFSLPEGAVPTSSGSTTMPPTVPPTQAGTKFCPKCGASLPSTTMYCTSCGAAQPT